MDGEGNSWWWSGAEGSNGAPGTGRSFESQEEAEAWLTSAWQDLLDDGVEEVSLMNGARCIYGPMPLTA